MCLLTKENIEQEQQLLFAEIGDRHVWFLLAKLIEFQKRKWNKEETVKKKIQEILKD